MNDKLCSNCIHNKYNYKDELYYCDNEHSDNYGVPTFYDDSCEDWEEK